VAQENPFSITLAFPHLDIPEFPRALALARESSDFEQTGAGAEVRYHARFRAGDAARLRAVFDVVQRSPATQILVDDQAVPFARELWMPLVSFLINP